MNSLRLRIEKRPPLSRGLRRLEPLKRRGIGRGRIMHAHLGCFWRHGNDQRGAQDRVAFTDFEGRLGEQRIVARGFDSVNR